METIIISAIICTYNRSNYLEKAIESLIKQDIDYQKYEIIVVDNNSTDSTAEVVRQYQQKCGNLRYIFEQDQGLSIARNRGVSEARGEYVAYIDDDAVAEPKWLASFIEAFGKDDKIVCVGGPVELDWHGEKPAWIPVRYESLFTYVNYGAKERYLTPDNYLVGANIGFKRNWLAENGGFPEKLGRKGYRLMSGEEAFLYKEVFESGNKVLYHPGAMIRHNVTDERKTKRWFFRRLFWDGATQPMLDSGIGQQKSVYLRESYLDLRRCLRFLLESVFAIIRINRDAFIDSICRLDQRLGRLYMHLRLSLGMKN
jgi:glycosyltransferase involved in cell wall biosynthesis